MKKLHLIILTLVLSISSLYSQVRDDFHFRPSVGIFYDNVKYYNKSDYPEITPHHAGIKLNCRLDFKHPRLQWIGTDFSLVRATYDDFVHFQFGIELRKKLFKDKFEIAAIIPKYNAPIDFDPNTGHNTPFGFAFRFFEGPFKIELEQIFFADVNISRVHFFYRFNNK